MSDPKVLLRITNSKDIKGKWWEIPFEKLENCSLAQCYLDARGVEFYLPAFMSGVVREPKRPCYCHLISWLTPGVNTSEAKLYDYFVRNFSFITGRRKTVCKEVLEYLLENLDPLDKYSDNEIRELLRHEYWQGAC
nr:DUF6714 family protein [Reinekea blandensis]